MTADKTGGVCDLSLPCVVMWLCLTWWPLCYVIQLITRKPGLPTLRPVTRTGA